ncbi:MAG: hypothetical protein ACREJR_05330 [Candidatus Rokuibacteriota bacterium]
MTCREPGAACPSLRLPDRDPGRRGAFTSVYVKGFSYLSTDPRACVNGHIMNPQFDG